MIVNKKSPRMDEALARRATQCDEMAARAKVRQKRALEQGNQREADGAARTIKEAQYTAAKLRAQIGK